MNDTGSTPKKDPQKNLDHDLNDLDLELEDSLDDLPSASASNIYTRTGKAAPTEVMPAAPQPAPKADAKAEQKADPKAVAEPEEVLAMADTTGEKPVKIVGGETTTPAATATAPASESPAAQDSAVSPAEDLQAAVAKDGVDPVAPAAQPAPLDRGTLDIGLLILRVVLGLVLILAAVGTFFQLGSIEGLAGLEEQLAGYNEPRILSIVLPTLQLAAGVFLVLGLITPLAATVAVAATGFTALDVVAGSSSPFNWDPAAWLAVTLLGLALAVQFTGPGAFGVDYARSWARRPLASSWIGAAVGLAAAGLMWWFL